MESRPATKKDSRKRQKLAWKLDMPGVILETEGSVRKIQKRHFVTTKKLKKGHP